jgi:hypothetical protein
MTLEELLAATAPPLYALGAAVYFAPETLEAGKAAGLDGFTFYFVGRGGVLGDVEAEVVSSAFGYFEPKLLRTFWDRGRQVVAPREAARLHLECAHRFGRQHFADIEGLDGFCAAAEAVAAAADPAALALFAGFAAEPLPDDVPARAAQLGIVLRELRGSVHLVAVVASGMAPRVAHYLRRPGEFGMFGWSPEDAPVVTGDDRRALAAADALTDRLLAVPYGVLDEAGRRALADGAGAIGRRLAPAT